MKNTLVTLLLLLVFAAPGVAKNIKIGHFDLQKVVAQSQAGKEARELYLQKAQGYQDEINQRTELLNRIKEEVKAAVAKLKEGDKVPPSIVEKDQQAASQFRELQRLLSGYQDELKRYDAEMTRTVLLKLQPILSDFAEKGKFDYLFKIAEPLVYAGKDHDITDDLIQIFDKMYKK